jgi:hypothetical protein
VAVTVVDVLLLLLQLAKAAKPVELDFEEGVGHDSPPLLT